MFKTIEQALKTKAAKIISVSNYNHNGQDRKIIKACKAKGKKVFMVVQYENGLFSSAV